MKTFTQDILIFTLFALGYSRAFDTSNCDTIVKRGDGLVCYKLFITKNSFDNSASLCGNNNMDFATIDSNAEFNGVVQLLQSRRENELWIGLKQIQTPWRWDDGSEIKEQGCFLSNLTTGHDTQLMDTKVADNSAISCSTLCSSKNFKYVGLRDSNQCYCGNSFGIETQNGASCTMNCPGSNNENCGGEESERIVSLNGLYSNWQNGQPNNNSGSGNQACATIFSTASNENGKWGDVSCSTSYRSICEIGLSDVFPTCDTIQKGVFSILYKNENGQDLTSCIYISETDENYLKAVQICNNVNGSLVKIISQSHNDAITKVLNDNVIYNEAYFWIGLTRFKLQYSNGEPVAYTKFITLDSSLKTSCASMTSNPTSDVNNLYIWTLDNCESLKDTLCQSTNATYVYKPTYFMTTTTTTTIPPTKIIILQPSTTPPHINITIAGGDKIPQNNSTLYATIGGAIGGVLLLILITVIVVVVLCKKKHKMPPVKPDVERAKSVYVEPTYFFGAGTENETSTPSSKENTINKSQQNNESNQPDVVTSSSPPPF